MSNLGTCDIDGCDEPAIAIVNENRGCADHINQAMTKAFQPVRQAMATAVLPYGGPDDANSGFAAGAATSEERARRDDADGTTSRRQRQVLTRLDHYASEGQTWKELAVGFGWHHGQASGALSNLHKVGKVARLTERRGRCFVYVLPEYVNGRETQEQGRARQPNDALAIALIQAEATIVRVEALVGDDCDGGWVVPGGQRRTCPTVVTRDNWCLPCCIRDAIGRE